MDREPPVCIEAGRVHEPVHRIKGSYVAAVDAIYLLRQMVQREEVGTENRHKHKLGYFPQNT